MGLRPGIRGSHSEFAVTQLLVDLPTKFGHVLLSEAEWLRQGQVLAILQHKGATVTVIILPGHIHFEVTFPALVEIQPVFLHCLCLQILGNMLRAAAVQVRCESK